MTGAAGVLSRFYAAVDARDWSAARALMADSVHLDFSSFDGAPAETLAADHVLARWKRVLTGFDSTRHALGELHSEDGGAEASVTCAVVARHVLGGRTWTLLGRYRATLRRAGAAWLLDGIRFEYERDDGDAAVLAAARARGRQSPEP